MQQQPVAVDMRAGGGAREPRSSRRAHGVEAHYLFAADDLGL